MPKPHKGDDGASNRSYALLLACEPNALASGFAMLSDIPLRPDAKRERLTGSAHG